MGQRCMSLAIFYPGSFLGRLGCNLQASHTSGEANAYYHAKTLGLRASYDH